MKKKKSVITNNSPTQKIDPKDKADIQSEITRMLTSPDWADLRKQAHAASDPKAVIFAAALANTTAGQSFRYVGTENDYDFNGQ